MTSVVMYLYRTSHRRCFVKKVFLEISQNSQENACTRVSFLIKLPQTCNFIKKGTLPQVFSCEFCEISKNTFSYRTPLDDCFCLYAMLGIIFKFYLKIQKQPNKTPQACNFIKKRLKHRCFPVNMAKFSRTPILKNICGCFLKYNEFKQLTLSCIML